MSPRRQVLCAGLLLCAATVFVSCGTKATGPQNRAPEVAFVEPPPRVGLAPLALHVKVGDADGDRIVLAYSTTQGTAGAVASTSDTATTVIFSPSTWGFAGIEVTANDGRGGTAMDSVRFYVMKGGTPAFTYGTRRCTSSCDVGWTCFEVRVTPLEAVELTSVGVAPMPRYTDARLATYALSPSVHLMPNEDLWLGVPDNYPANCGPAGIGSGSWRLYIDGYRAAPDSGYFHLVVDDAFTTP